MLEISLSSGPTRKEEKEEEEEEEERERAPPCGMFNERGGGCGQNGGRISNESVRPVVGQLCNSPVISY